jgi:putative ABC transport system permease protein
MTRKKWESDLTEELEFHLKMLEEENIRAGMRPEEAHRNAVLKLGGVSQIKELSREQRFGFRLETLWRDVVYGLRMLRKSLPLTLVSIATLVLAIAACTALFSVLNGILLHPLPYPYPERIAEVVETNISKGIARIEVNGRNLEDWRKRSTSFEGIAAYYTMGRTLSANNESEVVLASQVSSDFFHIFQTPPLLGRWFTEQESQATRYNQALGLVSPDPVVILSYGLWMRRFGSDPNIVGKTIILDRKVWKVIGVMPRHFVMPDARTSLWCPWGLLHETARDQHFAGAVARVAPGITYAHAEGELNSIADQLGKEFPETNEGWKVHLNSLQAAMTGDFKQILWFLLFAVGLVMVIACVNIAIVQLSGASARIQETSMRLALGASRLRLFQQYLIESSLISICGGVLGFALAYFAIHALQRIAPDLPRVGEIIMDWNVLLISVAITGLSALLFGLAPAFVATSNTKSAFSNHGTRSTSRLSTQRIRNCLVITEVALAVILLSSSGMLIRSFLRLGSTDFGFQPRNVLVVPIFLDTEKYNSAAKSRAYYKELIERLQSLPDVVSVGGATALPASPLGPDFQRPVWESGNVPQAQNRREADVRMVTTDYFKTLGISIVRGRRFSTQDGPDSPKVVMISESLAQQIWRGRDPIGKQLVVDYSTAGTYPYQVVGVVHDIRFHGPRSDPRPEIYFPHAQKPYLVLNIAIRTKNDPRLLIASVRNVLLAIDPQKPAHNITTLENLIGATVIRDRYAMILVSCFAFVSLMLASLGIYGVLSFFVRQRIPEIGIRMALGARQRQIIAWIRNQGALLMLAGLIFGLIGTLASSRLLSGILYQVSSRDFISLVFAIAVIVCTAVISAWIPARRASRVDPCKALRSL